MEKYERLKTRRTALKSAITRQTATLNSYLNKAEPSEAVFEDQRSALQFNLKSLRENLLLISSTLMELPETDYEDAAKDLETNELNLEKREAAAAKLKNAFDILVNAETKADATSNCSKRN